MTRFLTYFGLPHILHSDNGREFVNEVIAQIIQHWPGECNLINGRPRHPQSQGCVEKGNHQVEEMIRAKRLDGSAGSWASWLPQIQCKFLPLR